MKVLVCGERGAANMVLRSKQKGVDVLDTTQVDWIL
jgi:hypothetical protein